MNKDKDIVEHFGGCWHESMTNPCACSKCGFDNANRPITLLNPDLTSKEGFWDLWGWMRKRETWESFIYWLDQKGKIHPDDISPIILFIDNRTLFRDTVWEFIQTQKGE